MAQPPAGQNFATLVDMSDDARHRIVLTCGLPEEIDADVATVQIARYGWLDFITFERGTATALVELRFLR
eukprot:11187935-Lingulodinium_polyedra.AAC.1